MTKETLAQRLIRARTEAGIAEPATAARLVKLTPSALYQLEDGKTKSMKDQTAIRLAGLYGVRVEWLARGLGQQKAAAVHDEAAMYAGLRPIVLWEEDEELDPNSYVILPRLDSRWSCGDGEPDPESAEQLTQGQAFRAGYAQRMGWKPSTHFTMHADGESMEPTIKHGAPVVIDISQKNISTGDVYAIMLDGKPKLKRLFNLPSGMVRVASDNSSNPTFGAFDVARETIEVIGRAVWTASAL